MNNLESCYTEKVHFTLIFCHLVYLEFERILMILYVLYMFIKMNKIILMILFHFNFIALNILILASVLLLSCFYYIHTNIRQN